MGFLDLKVMTRDAFRPSTENRFSVELPCGERNVTSDFHDTETQGHVSLEQRLAIRGERTTCSAPHCPDTITHGITSATPEESTGDFRIFLSNEGQLDEDAICA